MANPEHERLAQHVDSNRLHNADLHGLDLSTSLLMSAHLEGANLGGANLHKADISGAYLQGANLSGAKMRKARLVLTDLRDADLSNAELVGCDLNSAVLSGARLVNANLMKAKLTRARLENVDLTGANLSGTDLRGAKGLTPQQLATAQNAEKSILDERTLAMVGRESDRELARHGRPQKRRRKYTVDLLFTERKPGFGDLFTLCGFDHPEFPATGEYGFSELMDLGVEQFDDYFAICRDGDPVIWIFPLVRGWVVEHHHGPFDGIQLDLADKNYKDLFVATIARFRDSLRMTVAD